MTLRKVPPLRVVLTVDECKRVTAYLSLLIQIDKRVNAGKRKAKSKKQPKSKDIMTRSNVGLFVLWEYELYFLDTVVYLEVSIFTQLEWQHMIDTVVLTLNPAQYHIIDPDRFTPSAHWVLTGLDSGIISKQNPTKKELAHGIYKPRLMLADRIVAKDKHEALLKIEVSLPKLMFGNNFDELQQKDFPAVLAKLVRVLQSMGVKTTEQFLAQAAVASIHYAKNIVFTDGTIPYFYINKIKEANIKLSLDSNKTDYRNEGHVYKWHCNSYEIVFYDKVKDLVMAKKSDKRAVEKDSSVQMQTLHDLQLKHKFEVLRMEVRLNKRPKIKQLFKTLGVASNFTFKSLFKLATAREVLLHYIDELESKRSVLHDYRASSDRALLTALLINNTELGLKQILQMYGLKKIFEIMPPRELRAMLPPSKQRSWYRLMADINKIKLPVARATFGTVREQVTKFKALKLVS